MNKVIAIFCLVTISLTSFADVSQDYANVGCVNEKGQDLSIRFNNGRVELYLNNGRKILYTRVIDVDKKGYTFAADRHFYVFNGLSSQIAEVFKISKGLAEDPIPLDNSGTIEFFWQGDKVAEYQCR